MKIVKATPSSFHLLKCGIVLTLKERFEAITLEAEIRFGKGRNR
jgi:hypothetical protein